MSIFIPIKEGEGELDFTVAGDMNKKSGVFTPTSISITFKQPTKTYAHLRDDFEGLGQTLCENMGLNSTEIDEIYDAFCLTVEARLIWRSLVKMIN